MNTHQEQTLTHCHCGAWMAFSDHCPECGCEEYESYCEHVSTEGDTVATDYTPEQLDWASDEDIAQAVVRAAAAAQDTLRRPTEAELDALFAELDRAFNPWCK